MITSLIGQTPLLDRFDKTNFNDVKDHFNLHIPKVFY